MEHRIQQIRFAHHAFDVVDTADDGTPFGRTFLLDFTREHQQFVLAEEEPRPPALAEEDAAIEPLVLSQRLSQLSTEPIDGKRQHSPTKSKLESATKKSRPNNPEQLSEYNEPFPAFLREEHPLLEQLLPSDGSLSFEDLQALAFFRHRMTIYQLHERLWLKLIRFGLGQMSAEDREEIEQIPILQHTTAGTPIVYGPFWQPSIERWLLSRPSVTVLREQGEQNLQDLYEYAATERLAQARERLGHYQLQYQERKSNGCQLTKDMEELIGTMVDECGVRPFRLQIDWQLAELKNDFREHLIQKRFSEEDPTAYQTTLLQRLFELHSKLEEAKYDHIKCRERIRHNQPSTAYDGVIEPMPKALATLMDSSLRTQVMHEYEQWTERLKSNLMAIELAVIEAKIDQYQNEIDSETKLMWKNHQEQRSTHEINPNLMHLFDKRLRNMQEKLRAHCDYVLDATIRAGTQSKERRVGFVSSLIVDSRIPRGLVKEFTSQQLQLIRRGPTYVAPCQLHLPSAFASNEARLKHQYTPLHQRLVRLLGHCRIFLLPQENCKAEMKREFHTLFADTLPNNDQLQRAIYENETIRSIRATLSQQHLLLRRTADDQNTFYLGHQSDFDAAVQHYMSTQTAAYTVLYTLDATNRSEISRKLQTEVRRVNTELEQMFKEKKLTQEIYDRLRINADRIQLPYLYFLPRPSKDRKTLTVQPRFAAYQSSTAQLARFLQQVLRPKVQSSMRESFFLSETDFIERMHRYAHVDRYLKPETLFVMIKLTNFPVAVPHATLIEHVRRFLNFHLADNRLDYKSRINGRLQSITINTCLRLLELYLEQNHFYYDKKIYKFARGAPNCFILTELLSIMYFSMWHHCLRRHPLMTDEFLGGYKNQMLLTWNGSMEECQQFLRSITERSPEVPLLSHIGKTAYFLDIYVENLQGRLYTRVSRGLSALSKDLSLPYVVNHPSVEHRHWFHSALIRAVRCCSNVDDFNIERIRMEIAYLSHGYSRASLETMLTDFYRYFNWNASRFHVDQPAYGERRQRMVEFAERQRLETTTWEEFAARNRTIHLHYLFDHGPQRSFYEKFFQLWLKYLQEDDLLSLRKTNVVLTGKQIYSLNSLFNNDKPSDDAHLLINMPL